MENTEIIKHEESAIFAGTNNSSYSSMKPKTMEEKKKLFNVMEHCDGLINNMINQEIEIKDVIINEYPRKDKETGEPLSNGHRTIIITPEGKSYVTASNYFFVTLAKVMQTFNTPDTWESPLKIKIVNKDIKDGKKALGFELV